MSGVPAAADPSDTVAMLLAVDPLGLGGAVLRIGAGADARCWLDALRALMPSGAPWRRLPLGIDEGRLLGGLDLAATLAAGRTVAQRGLLADASGGVLVVSSAERIAAVTAAHLCAVLDTGEVVLERDGLGGRHPARLCVLAQDEGVGDERVAPALAERVAFLIDLGDRPRGLSDAGAPARLAAARLLLPAVELPDAATAAICAAAAALGAFSMRASVFAGRAARAAAALAGRTVVEEADLATAVALVIAPRATRLPPEAAEESGNGDEGGEDRSSPPPEESGEDAPDASGLPTEASAERLVEAARAAIPTDLLRALTADAAARRGAPNAAGRAGAPIRSPKRGRPIGARRGSPVSGARIALVDTLRAAAPWQRLRQGAAAGEGRRIQIRSEDFRVARFKDAGATVTIFAVDASGSAALHRMAEAKGAVELILADCYVRRDEVALIAFRRSGAELLLPPTRSLARAKRALAGQVGGGGTPLALAIQASAALADMERRRGRTPFVVLLTDGKANIDLDGNPGRARADADARSAASRFRAAGFAALLLDIAPRPGPASTIAAAMGARYVPLPFVDAATMSKAVRANADLAAPSREA